MPVLKRAALLAVGAVLLLAVDPVNALDPIAVLSPSDVPPGYSNGAGFSVDISGRFAVIGAPYDPWYNGDSTGAVYVFRRYGPSWVEAAKLTAEDGVWPDRLGWSVAIEGDVILAGAPKYEFPGCNLPGGSAYVFRRDDQGTPDDFTDDTWPFETKFPLGSEPVGPNFGIAVAVSGNTVVVGSDCGDTLQVYRRVGNVWSHEASLTGSDMVGRYGIGTAIAIHGDRIVAGALNYQDVTGAAFVFQHLATGWVEETILTPSVAEGSVNYGQSVGIYGDSIVVGAPKSYDDATWGGAFVYANEAPDLWREQPKLTAPGVSWLEELGLSVAIDGDLVVAGKVGEPWAILFRENETGWEASDVFHGIPTMGQSVAIDGKYAAVLRDVYVVRERKDLLDFTAFVRCFTGSNATEVPENCRLFDLTNDGLVDWSDFEEFVGTLAGP